MEQTIYKPSIYKGAGIYKTGAGGVVKPKFSSVELFGKNYDTVIIDDLEIIRYNFDYQFSGLNIGLTNSSIPSAVYVDNDENIWGWNGRKCGLLYNFEAQLHIENYELNDGWRVMTLIDIGKILSYIQNNNYFDYGKELVKNESWASLSGEDQIYISVLPCGAAIADGTGFYQTGNSYYINLNSSSKLMAYCRPEENYTIRYGSYSAAWFTPIRLCKDV